MTVRFAVKEVFQSVEGPNRGIETERGPQHQREDVLLIQPHRKPWKILSVSTVRGKNQTPWFDIP